MQEHQLKILCVLSAFYLRLGDASRALALIAVAAEAAPHDAAVAEMLIRCHLAVGQADAALTRLDWLATRYPDRRTDKNFQILRSRALWMAGRRTEARQLYARAIEGGVAAAS